MGNTRDASGVETVFDSPSGRGGRGHWSDLWRSDPKGMSIDLLRVGMGLIWILNMTFILVPANRFFPTFQGVALSFAPTSLGGPGVADFVAAHSLAFAWMTAVLTAYLAVAFLVGVTTRLACIVGGVASVIFLGTQFLSTFQLPGGTDVGPHPLYLLIYLILFTGGAGKYAAVDHWIWTTDRAKLPRLSRWLAAPRQRVVPRHPGTSVSGTRSEAPPFERDSSPLEGRSIFAGPTNGRRLNMKD